ncbi:MAG: 4'-phosphopantetheinyl transferase family protein [Elusimicrobiales bacterium]
MHLNYQLCDIKRFDSYFKGIKYVSSTIAYTAKKDSDINDNVYLNSDELDYIPFIKSEKRRLEYTLVRYLAKSFLSEIIGGKGMSLRGGVRGRPYAVCHKATIPLSYSHRGGVYAVSFSPDGSIMSGIDVERFEKVNISSFYDFFSDLEVENEDDLIVKWSIKESILKMVWCGLSLAASDIEIISSSIIIKGKLKDIFEAKKIFDFKTLCYIWKDYVVSVSLCSNSYKPLEA